MAPLMTARDVQSFLQISRSTLYAWLAEGRLPRPIRIGRNAPRWDAERLRDWALSRTEPQ